MTFLLEGGFRTVLFKNSWRFKCMESIFLRLALVKVKQAIFSLMKARWIVWSICVGRGCNPRRNVAILFLGVAKTSCNQENACHKNRPRNFDHTAISSGSEDWPGSVCSNDLLF